MNTLKVLLIGSGAREHAIARAIKRSATTTHLFCFSPMVNPGLQQICDTYQAVDINDINLTCAKAQALQIDFAIIGPEAPLAKGLSDVLQQHGIFCFGPTKKLAQIESSKAFTRQLLCKYLPDVSPKFNYFESLTGFENYTASLGFHYVIKADGLMGGKGVFVSDEHFVSQEQALSIAQQCLDSCGSFVVEEKLIGEEFSLLSFCDGTTLKHMPLVQDHKRAFEGDEGPNTGGMGSYSLAHHGLPFLTQEDIRRAQMINQKVIHALQKEISDKYQGVIYGGFMATAHGIKVIEYNARFGDPEAINLLPLLEDDFIELCLAIKEEKLNQLPVKFQHRSTVCKYVVPNGYPSDPIKDKIISFDPSHPDMYTGSVTIKDDNYLLAGSRAVACLGIGLDLIEAEQKAERLVHSIEGPVFHRIDIGKSSLVNQRLEHFKKIKAFEK